MSSIFKGTFSRFSRKARTETKPLPEPTEEPKTVAPKPKEVEQENETAEQEQDRVDEQIDPPPVATKQKLVKKTPAAKENQDLTGDQTVSTAGNENIYQLTWREAKSYNLTPVRHARVNTFVPNSIPLFRLLEAAELRLESNRHIQTHEARYLPYAVKVYYAIMYYMQILEAKSTAGNIEGDEASLLNRFSKKYPRASLPCAEIVYGYFNTIASTELADEKYDWITPTVDAAMFSTHANNGFTDYTVNDNGAQYFQPLVPFMMGVLNSFIQNTNVQGHVRNGTFTPLVLSTNGNKTVFGQTFANNSDVLAAFKLVFQAAGASTPVRFGNSNFPEAQEYAADTDFGHNVKLVATVTDARDDRNLSATNYTFGDLDTFLFMGKRQQGYSNLKWFEYLREQAVIHARFFDQVYHFSDVQTTAGLENTIFTKLKRDSDTGDIHNSYYFTKAMALGQQVTWYRNPLKDLVAGFATSRAGIRRNEELQALTYGTNATLPILVRNAEDTDFDNAAVPVGSTLRSGAFFDNKEWLKQFNNNNLVSEGKPMYSDFKSVALRCMRDKPHGTGVVDNDY